MARVWWNRGTASEPEEQCGGAVWLGHASGDHATVHADIGIAINISSQGPRGKSNRVTSCQNEFPTTLQTKDFANSQVGATNFFEKQY